MDSMDSNIIVASKNLISYLKLQIGIFAEEL